MRVNAIAIFLFSCIFAEELERESRGLDSQGFKALIELGKLINNFGIENIEDKFHGVFSLISKNVVIFYFLIFACFLAHLVTFLVILFAVRSKPETIYNLRETNANSDFTLYRNFDTNDRDYWPTPATPANSLSDTYV